MQIRTVASIGQEDYFYKKYLDLLEGLVEVLTCLACHLVFSMGVIFFSNAAAFRMGGYLSANKGLKLGDMMK